MSAASRSKERERGTDGWTDGQTDTERETKQKHVELSRGSLTARPSVSFFSPRTVVLWSSTRGRLIIGRRKPQESAVNSPLIWSSWQRDGPISLLALEEEVCDGSRLPGKTQRNPANMVTTDFHFLFFCFCFSKVCQSGKTLYKITV